jgi:methionine-rich copper-binding protein CopC
MRNPKVLLIAVGLVFSGSQSAVAHAELVKSFPVTNSTLAKAPKYVQLEFGEDLTTLKSKSANLIMILDPKAHTIPTSKIVIKKNIARVEIIDTLKSGKYTIKYRVVSADGHVLNAQFKFILS